MNSPVQNLQADDGCAELGVVPPLGAPRACDVLLLGHDAALDALDGALQARGYTVDRVVDADVGLMLLRYKAYRVLLLDLLQPDDGELSLLQAVAHARVRRPHAVLVLAARPPWTDRGAMLERGVDDCISKPFEVKDLMPYVDRWLRRGGPGSRRQLSGIRIYTLGRFAVEHEGELLLHAGGRSRKASMLFKVLLTRHNRMVPAVDVINILWPRAPDDVAATDLRSLLHQLRKLLGAPAKAIEHTNAVLTLRLTQEDWWDVSEFNACLAEGALWQRHGNNGKAIEAYAAGAMLYEGDFLSEDSDAEWARPFRDQVRENRLRALETLAKLLGERGDDEAQENCLRTVLRADPFREQSTRALMEVLAAQGRSAEALLLYRTLKQIVNTELETDPDPQTQALATRLRQRP